MTTPIDRFAGAQSESNQIQAPSNDFLGWAPSDTMDVPKLPRGVYVGTAGDVTCDCPNAASVLFASVPAGTVLPIRPTRIRATGTTASGLVLLF
jgi:hypothetical protein